MKIINQLSRVAVFVILFSSCDKEPKPIQLEVGEYYRTGIEEAGSIRVFTQAGEIKIDSLIEQFELYSSLEFDSRINYLNNTRSSIDSIIVHTSKRATIGSEDRTINYEINSTESFLKLTSSDTLKGFIYDDVYTKSLDYHIGMHKPVVLSEYLVSSGNSYGFCFTYHSQVILTKEAGKPKAPLILAYKHYANYSNQIKNIQNFIDPNFYKLLLPGDTVVLQEYMKLYDN